MGGDFMGFTGDLAMKWRFLMEFSWQKFPAWQAWHIVFFPLRDGDWNIRVTGWWW